jgi:hypothetical protein
MLHEFDFVVFQGETLLENINDILPSTDYEQ